MPDSKTGTHQKALAVNLDQKLYGTIAEIGAGQEVSRWFFQVGGAAGTVAKTISAYDMAVSDQIYGKGTRYVSRERTQAMLEHEFTLLIERLGETRGKNSCFFVFADSVSARNYSGTNECHGWLGLRYQPSPGAGPEEILLHVNMRDRTNQLQQEALGILGVNLIHAVFFCPDPRNQLLSSLLENISPGRLEIDALYWTSKDSLQPTELGLQLIERGLCHAVLFERPGKLVPPTEAFHNRPLLLLRANIERSDSRHLAGLLSQGVTQLSREGKEDSKPPLAILELSSAQPEDMQIDLGALRQRLLPALEVNERVLVTSYRENYLLTRYLRNYAPEQPIRFVTGTSSLVLLFEKRYYSNIPGQVLEGLGRLFADNVKVYVKPMSQKEFIAGLTAAGARIPEISSDSDEVGVDNISFEPPLDHLFRYLRSIDALVPLRTTEYTTQHTTQHTTQ